MIFRDLFDSLTSFLQSYGDYEDVVDGVYELLRMFVQVHQATKGSQDLDPNIISPVKMMEDSKAILTLAIKHASIFDSEKAYAFLQDLIKASEKYAKSRP